MRAAHAAAALVSLALACTVPPSRSSTDISTRDIRLDLALEDTGAGTTWVRATLLGPFGDFDLVGGDTFSASAAGKPLPLVAEGQGVFTNLAPVLGGDFVFDLVRPEDRGARVTVSTPPDTGLVADPPTARSLPLRWTPSGGAFVTTLNVRGPCIAGGTVTLASDAGAYVIDVAALGPKGGGCTLTATLTRTASGSAYLLGDPWMAYTARQTRAVDVAWSP